MKFEINFSNARIQQYVDFLKANGTSRSTIDRKISSLNSFQNFLEKKGLLTKPTKNSNNAVINKISPNTSKNFLRRYLIFGTLIAIILGLGYGLYTQTILKAKQELAYSTSSTLTRPGRVLSFQGRLTDSVGNAIIVPTDIVFKFYNSSIGGTELYSSSIGNSQTISPDENGIFNVVIGKTHGTEIPSSVFSENAEIWLEITADSEVMDPRQQIATVAYALNSETLQGIPPSASGTKDTVLVIDSLGNLNLGETSPTIKSTSGTMAIEGQALLLKASDGSGGNITINPDGNGTIRFLTEGTSPNTGGFLDLSNNNIAGGILVNAQINNSNRGYEYLSFSNYDIGTTNISTRFSVGASGNVYISQSISMGSTALANNLNADLLDGLHSSAFLQVGSTGFFNTALNGLQTIGFTGVGLGGTLSQNTIINTSSNYLSFLGLGNTQSLFIGASGYIGIGTTNPISRLSFNEGTTPTDGISFGTDTNLYRVYNNTLQTDSEFWSTRKIGVNTTGASTIDLNTNNSSVVESFRFLLNNQIKHQFGNYTGNNEFFIDSYDSTNTKKTSLTINADSLLFNIDPNNEGWKMTFGQDVNLYRNNPGTLKTDGNIEIGGSFISVGSTNLVTNLNADLLDGFHESYFLNVGQTANFLTTLNDGVGISISGTGTGRTIAVNYDSNNLRITGSNQLNTIQDITTTSNPTFAGLGLGATSSSYLLNVLGNAYFSTALTVGTSLSVGTNLTVGGSFISVGSTNLVTNLNADLLDGFHQDYFLNVGQTNNFITTLNDGVGISISGTGTGRTIAVNYDSNNLRITGSNQLNTIQDITTTSNPTFAGLGLGATSSSYLLNVLGNAYFSTALTVGTSLSVGTNLTVGGSFISVGSTNLVTNLNADLLDGFHQDYFLNVGQTNNFITTLNDGVGISISGTGTGRTIAVNYDSNNLRITGSNQLNTIQDITTTSNPTFAGLGLGATSSSYLLNVLGNAYFSTALTVGTSLSVGTNLTVGGSFISVGSTNLVTNLNADLLDGFHQDYFLNVGQTNNFITTLNDGVGISISGTGTGRTIAVNYDSNNLRITGSNQLNTIQDITTTSNPTFAGLGLGATSSSYLLNVLGNAYFSTALTVGTSLSVGTNLTVGGSFISVGSTNLVTNLNADLLDGFHQDYFLNVGQTNNFITTLNDGVGISISGTGTGRTIAVNYDSNNLRITGSNQLNTIQDITTTSNPTFAGLGLGATSSSYLLNVLGNAYFSTALTVGTSLSVGTNLTVGGSFISVGSTNLVTNLNADYLDGLNSSAFLQVGSTGFFNTALNGLQTIGSTGVGLGGTLTQNTTIGTSSFNLSFLGLGGTQSLFIGASGYVGIGTTNPTGALDIVGSTDGDFGISVYNNNPNAYVNNLFTNNLENGLYVGIGGSNLDVAYADRGYLEGIASGLSLITYGDIRFYSGDSVDSAEVLRVTSAGNVGIGTTNPSQKLDINGSVNIGGSLTVGTNLTIGGTFVSVGSTNLVTNLNADLLDGFHESYFLNVGQTSNFITTLTGGSGVSITGSGVGRTIAASITNGLGFFTGSIGVSSPTCGGTDKLQWTGTAFTCTSDVGATYAAGVGLTLSNTNVFSLDLASTNVWLAPQYFSNGIGVTGNTVLQGNLTIGGTFVSVGSTNLVTNLNADYLDGLNSSAFLQVGSTGFFNTALNGLQTIGSTGVGLGGTLTQNTTIGTSSFNLSFLGLGGTQSLFIGASGYVGIGTTNPRQQLSIGDYLDIYSGINNNSNQNSIRASAANLILNAKPAGNLYLNFDSGVDTYIVGSGNVGIGTTNPSQKLDINGSVNIGGSLTVGTNLTIGGTFVSVGSTNLVTNLNADLLDGFHESYFLNVGQTSNFITTLTGGSGVSITGSGVGRTIAASITNGLGFFTGSIGVSSPTCGGTDKLQWTGTAFTCTSDVGATYAAGVGLTLSNTNVFSLDLASTNVWLAPQYFSNGIGVTGNTVLQGNLTIGGTFVSVGSTNLVTNLNADYLDGLNSSAFLQVGSTGFFNTALNGLQTIGSTGVGLGGTLTQNTTIGTSSFNLSFLGLGGTQSLFIGASGYVGIGTTNPISPLHVDTNLTSTPNSFNNSSNYLNLTPGADNSNYNNITGTRNNITIDSSNTRDLSNTMITANRAYVGNQGTGDVRILEAYNGGVEVLGGNITWGTYGMYLGSYIEDYNSSISSPEHMEAVFNPGIYASYGHNVTVTDVYGFASQPSVGAYNTGSSLNITNLYGGYIDPEYDVDSQANLSITNLYGLKITNGSSNTAGVTNKYGLYLENQTLGSNSNFTIYSAGGINYFGGNVGIGTTNPTSKLHVIGNANISTSLTVGTSASIGSNLTVGGTITAANTPVGVGTSVLYMDASGNITRGLNNAVGTTYAAGVGLTLSNTNVFSLNLGNTNVWLAPQYFSNGIGVTGNTVLQGNLTIGGTFVSVGSTNLVTNLNADLLDGFHESYFLNVGQTSNFITTLTGGSGVSITGSGVGRTIAASITNGLGFFTGSIGVSSPTCGGTDKLQWTGTAFTCTSDVGATYAAGVGLTLSNTNVFSLDLASTNVWLAPQYFSNGIGVTGNTVLQGNLTIGGTFVSVGSTNLVTNLNADYLDGLNSSAFLQVGSTGFFNTALNGLQTIGSTGVGLGGTLTQNTTIGTSSFNLSFLGLGGTQSLFIGASGYVGIGTTAPSSGFQVSNGGAILGSKTLTANSQNDVILFSDAAGTKAQSGSYYNKLKIFGGTSAVKYLALYQTASSAYIDSTWDDLRIITSGDNADIYLTPNGTGDVLINSGNVGIGTTNPLYKLQVIGDVGVSTSLTVGTSASIGSNLTVGGTITAANTPVGVGTSVLYIDASGNITRGLNNAVGTTYAASNGLGMVGTNIIGLGGTLTQNTTIGTSSFSLSFLGLGNSQSLFIGTSGYVGIGTTNPIAPFTIGSLNSNGVAIAFKAMSGANDIGLRVGTSFVDVTTSDTSAWRGLRASSIRGQSYEDSWFIGNVGIGTTNPLSKFHVNTGTDQNFRVGSYASELYLASYNDANSGFRPMHFYATEYNFNNGNVGIGTTEPLYKLQVIGDVGVSTSLTVGTSASIGSNLTVGGTITAANTPVGVGTSVLYIDASGNITRGLNNAVGTTYAASNGLGMVGTNIIGLGGTLTQNTQIGTSSFSLSFLGLGNSLGLSVGQSGYVGIGTSSPAYKLHVVGDTNITGHIASGGVVNPSSAIGTDLVYSWTGSEATVLRNMRSWAQIYPTSNLPSNETRVMEFTGQLYNNYNYGNIRGVLGAISVNGNGTLTEADGFFSNINLYGVGNSGSITYANDYRADGVNREVGQTGIVNNMRGFYATNLGNTAVNTSYGLYMDNQSGANIASYAIYTNTGTVRFGDTVNAIGNVNIGGTLSLTGTNVSTGATALMIATDGSVTKRSLGALAFQDVAIGTTYGATNGLSMVGTNIIGLGGTLTQNTTIGTSDYSLSFIGLGGTQTLFIGSTGYVGLGTINPQAKLDVVGGINLNGTIKSVGNSFVGGQIFLGTYNPNAFESSRIRLTEKGANYQGGFLHYDGESNILNLGVHNADDTMPANDYNSLSIVRSTGFIGIGTSAPTQRLEVNGSANIGGSLAVTSNLSVGGTITAANTPVGVGTSVLYIDASGNITRGLNNAVGTTYAAGVGLTLSNTNVFSLNLGNTNVWLAPQFFSNGIGVTGNTVLQGNLTIGGTFVSVGSTNLVTNLNANYLNGHPDTYFVNIGQTGGFIQVGYTGYDNYRNWVANVGTSNLTIGTTSTLSFASGIGVSVSMVGNTIIFTNTGLGTTYSATNGLNLNVSNQFGLGGTLTQNTRLNIGNTDVIYFQLSTGNVGIGTTNPSQKLDINGSVNIGGSLSVATNLTVGGTVTFTGLPIGTGTSVIYLGAGGNLLSGTLPASGVYTATNGLNLNANAFGLGGTLTQNTQIGTSSFSLSFLGLGNSLGLSVGQSGYVGIGTSNPQSLLHIAGINEIAQIGTDSGTNNAYINFNSSRGFIGISPNNGISNGVGSLVIQGGNSGGTARGISFYVGTPSTGGTFLGGTEAMVIMPNTAYIGIGNTNPTQKLDINGSVNIGGSLAISTNLTVGGTITAANTPVGVGTSVLYIDASGNITRGLNNAVGTTYAAGVGLTLSNTNVFSLNLGNTNVWLAPQFFSNGIGVTGNTVLQGNLTIGGTFVSVGSTNLVTNLNANYLNGHPDTYFVNIGQTGGFIQVGYTGYDNYRNWVANVGTSNYTVGSTATLTFNSGVGISVSMVGNTITFTNTGVGITYSAGSGLSLAANVFSLGGTLTQNTRFNIGNTDVMFFDYATGNVGIGTTNPTTKLEIGGATSIISNNSGDLTIDSASGNISLNGDSLTNFLRATGASGSLTAPTYSFASDTDTGMYSGGANILRFSIGSTDRLTINSTGNVGIGTTDPLYKLQVIGDVGVSTSLTVGTSASIGSNLSVGGSVTFSGLPIGTGTTILYIGAGGALVQGTLPAGVTYTATNGLNLNANAFGLGGTIANTNYTNINISTGSSGLSFLGVNNNTQALIIRANGNVGMGTTAPTYKLHVVGNEYVSTALTVGTSASIGSNLSVGGSVVANSLPIGIGTSILYIDNSGVVYKGLSIGTTYGATNGLNLTSGYFGLGGTLTQNTQIGTSSYTLSFLGLGNSLGLSVGQSGYVGIGTSNPGYKLHVVGNEYVSTSLTVGTSISVGSNMSVGGSIVAASLPIGIGNSVLYIDSAGNITKGLNVGTTYGATNGLSIISSNFGLGGTLTQNTQIGTSSYTLSFLGLGNSLGLSVGQSGYVGIGTSNPGYKLHVVGDEYVSTSLTVGTSASIGSNLSVGGTITAANTPVGVGTSMLYINAAGVVTKGSLPAGTTYTAGNGLNLNGTTFNLGGTLTENTRINVGKYRCHLF